jgi:hypothetical protein
MVLQDAFQAAQDLLDRRLRRDVPDVVIASVEEYPTGWVFGYNTRRFLEDRELLASLLGGPIVVPKSGEPAYFGDGALPADEQLTGKKERPLR